MIEAKFIHDLDHDGEPYSWVELESGYMDEIGWLLTWRIDLINLLLLRDFYD